MPFIEEPKDALVQSIDGFTELELDALPHGAIQLDSNGIILQYNSYESELANISKIPDESVGKPKELMS